MSIHFNGLSRAGPDTFKEVYNKVNYVLSKY